MDLYQQSQPEQFEAFTDWLWNYTCRKLSYADISGISDEEFDGQLVVVDDHDDEAVAGNSVDDQEADYTSLTQSSFLSSTDAIVVNGGNNGSAPATALAERESKDVEITNRPFIHTVMKKACETDLFGPVCLNKRRLPNFVLLGPNRIES